MIPAVISPITRGCPRAATRRPANRDTTRMARIWRKTTVTASAMLLQRVEPGRQFFALRRGETDTRFDALDRLVQRALGIRHFMRSEEGLHLLERCGIAERRQRTDHHGIAHELTRLLLHLVPPLAKKIPCKAARRVCEKHRAHQ